MEVGKGAYGTVSIVNGLAVKKFRKHSHLVQETLAGIFLRGQEHVVEYITSDFRDLTLTMKTYPLTLRKWMNEVESQPTHLKNEVTKQLLLGLIEIHSLHLVHGDIKPGNILLSKDPIRLVIADLGFISLRPYSKCERTAQIYRDTNVKSGPSHDIYSTGIILLEMFGNLVLKEQAKYNDLHAIAKHEIEDVTLSRVIKDMLHEDHNKRPSAGQVYHKLFGTKIMYPPVSSNFEVYFEYPEVKAIMKKIATKYGIIRPNRGYKALCNYLEQHKREYKQNGPTIYACCMVFMLSSVFSKYSVFDEKTAAQYCKCSEEKIIDMTGKLCMNDEVVTYLMSP